ncbi:MAG: hypothetical protein ACRCYQ_04130 [Nocardioides sp.]
MAPHALDHLAAEPVQATIARLERRIAARFPHRGLRRLAGELISLAADVAAGSNAIRGRARAERAAARCLSVLVLAITIVGLFLAFRGIPGSALLEPLEWVQLVESTINDLVFAGIAVFFLYAIPMRLERNRLLALLHRLRSLAHIVDMHQLAKDPEQLRDSYAPTSESVVHRLDRDQMEHYLDYCSELLSLVGKVAALCAEESRDPVVLDTVSTVETLTTGLSRKIWQKISLLHAV